MTLRPRALALAGAAALLHGLRIGPKSLRWARAPRGFARATAKVQGRDSQDRRRKHEALLAAASRSWPRGLQREGLHKQLPRDSSPRVDASPFSGELPEGIVRCRLRAAYDGTQYNGWARVRQGSPLTVAGLVDAALSLQVGSDVYVQGASRTDAGVHARGQAAHFDLPAEVAAARPEGWQAEWEAKVNSWLPADVRVRGLSDAPPGFHATLSAAGKTYAYRLQVGAAPPDPLERLYRHRIQPAWADALQGDLGRLRAAASHFVGTHDFAYFAREDASRPGRTTVRTIRGIEVVDEGGGRCRIDVHLDGALWKMVRNVVGCVVAAACGKFSSDLIPEMLSNPPQRQGGAGVPFPCFPAEGLCLERVHYAEEEF